MTNETIKPQRLKYILGYVAGSVFIVSIIIYIYMLIVDNLEHEKHTTEEISWIYGFFIVLVVGFVVSYYTISKSNLLENKEIDYAIENGKRKNSFVGKSKLPLRSPGGNKKIISTKYTI